MTTPIRTRARAGLREIARQAGVSEATVSRALNNRENIAPATRARIQLISTQLGYQALRVKAATRVVGLAINLSPIDYVFDLVIGVGAAVHDHGGRFEIGTVASHPMQVPDPVLLAQFLSSGIDGALLTASTMSSDELASLRDRTCPFVVVDPWVPLDDRIPQVGTANFAGSRAATEHLLQLGHSRIGIITGMPGIQSAVERLAGYHAVLAGAGVPILPELQLLGHMDSTGAGDLRDRFPFEIGYEPAMRLLRLPEPPTAILAFNDAVAVGVMRAAHDLNLDIPRDLSLIGFDDTQFASVVSPTLTTVRQPVAEMGRAAVDMLYRLMERQTSGPWQMTLATSLIVRDSTGPVPGA
jgi:LacI family transcriptional regulator